MRNDVPYDVGDCIGTLRNGSVVRYFFPGLEAAHALELSNSLF